MNYLYFHGFASSPASRKAVFFKRELERHSLPLTVPALDQGDFEHLTISRQLKLAENLLQGEPATLMGSSMGGYLAALYAAQHPEVSRLVLLAPAFGLGPRWKQMMGDEKFAAWHESGWLDVFHYGAKQQSRVHYGLYEDSLSFPPFPDFQQPALIFHGTGDTVVPIELSREFVSTHTNARLVELNSDHELTDVLDTIGLLSIPFLSV